ncbi:maintenance of telomere capping protein 1 [[Candida] jaroonii]|uniref:Maintenance of telomere capping protein 1 n=1 Tax=[Candida] jaroonii TaxID=467808 RepID=A0ACA9Y606_9ASCO|nr:maintenance of telomere capping protein 1 [[Candida] jaroonii]
MSKDDVLDFINSLPDSKSGTPNPEGKEDLMDFLDELEAHDKKPVKFEPKKGKKDKKEKEKKPLDKKEKTEDSTVSNEGGKKEALTEIDVDVKPKEVQNNEEKSANEELEIDPINSITNWWNKEGSNAVSSLWGSITSNASNLSETTYQIASTTTNQLNLRRQEFLKNQETNGEKTFEQITSITNRLNGILSNISETIIGNEDELLNIIIVNDFYLPYLHDLINKDFGKVMGQVEGGIKLQVNDFNHKKVLDNELNLFVGKKNDGEKLCLANLTNSIENFQKAIEFEKNENTEMNEKLKLINKSNVFISILPISIETSDIIDENEISIDQNNKSFQFVIILKDITNNITIKTKTQAFPLIWNSWLTGKETEKFNEFDINPKEWVKDWIKDGLNVSIGIVAQEYVIKRMGF